MPSETASCCVCKKPAQQKCGGCHLTYYCSREHQKSDWKTHKACCKPYEICENEIVGRHLVATRNLKPGDLILREPPLIWGPSQVTIPVCLGCGKGLKEKQHTKCKKCGWPMCSEVCQSSPSHLPECSYTVNRGDKVSISIFGVPNPTYQCICTLRCLYNKQFLPEVWKKIDKLQSHTEERKKTEKYRNEQITVAAFIRRFFKLDMFEEDEIMRICGIIMVNGHEVPLSDPPHVAIYETTSMFEHSCRANCSKTFTSTGNVLITAGVPIKKGEHLSICYTDPLWGTANRRHHLFESKYFWCSCSRCSDATEFGTYFSGVKCKNSACKGICLPKTFLVNELEDNWYCNECDNNIHYEEINHLLEDTGNKLQEMQKGNSSACKYFIKHCETILSHNHHYITDVKFALTQLIGQEYHGGLANVSDDDLSLKIKICTQVLELANVLAPAENRIRGVLLFELHAAIAEIGRRKGGLDGMGPDYLFSMLSDSRRHLIEAIEALKHESEVMPEGKICMQARKNVKQIDVLLENVCMSAPAPL